MEVVTQIKKMPPLPLSNNTLLNSESQVFYPKKKGDFFYLIIKNKLLG